MRELFNRRKVLMTCMMIIMIAVIGVAVFTNATNANSYVLEVIDEGKDAVASNHELEMAQKIVLEESDDSSLVYELSMKNVVERNTNIEVALVIDSSYSMKDNVSKEELTTKIGELATDILKQVANARISVSDNSGIKLALSNNANSIKTAISSVIWGKGNHLETGIEYANNSFSKATNTRKICDNSNRCYR